MAYNVTITCIRCKKNKNVIVSSGSGAPLVCGDCTKKEREELRDKYFAGLDKLSMEERVRRIEEWIYDYKPTYVPPPRF